MIIILFSIYLFIYLSLRNVSSYRMVICYAKYFCYRRVDTRIRKVHSTCIFGVKNKTGTKYSYSLSLVFGMISRSCNIGHYGFPSFPIVDWFCLFIYLWVLTFPLEDYLEFSNFVITLIIKVMHYYKCNLISP
jgi:hypothetical protein